MYTELGKYLRHLRIEHTQTLLDMSRKLNVSASFISLIEHGKKKPSESFVDKIKREYELDELSAQELEKAINMSAGKIDIDIKDLSKENKEIALMFARKIETLPEKILLEIKDLIQKGEKDEFNSKPSIEKRNK